jgi:hypothetical protein
MANELRVRANYLPQITLDAAYDPSSDTAISAPGLADWPVVDATNHLAVIVDWDRATAEPFIIYITAHSTGATTATVAEDQEGTTATSVPSGTNCIHGPTVRDYVKTAHARRTAGDVVLNGTAWADVDTAVDLTLEAYPGDIVSVSVSHHGGSEAVVACYDAVSVVSGSPVNSWAVDGAVSATSRGVLAWREETSVEPSAGGTIARAIVAGDLSSNTLTIRLRGRTLTAAAKTERANADLPLAWSAVNHGAQYVAPTY